MGIRHFFRRILKPQSLVELPGHNFLKSSSKLEDYKAQLEKLIQERTDEILQLNRELIVTNEELYTANEALMVQRDDLEKALSQLKNTQNRLVHSEKMASLGVLVAGIAHEINNPINFINTGILGIKENIPEIFSLLESYRNLTPENCKEQMTELKKKDEALNVGEAIDLVQSLLKNIETGIDRTVTIVKGLRTFARSDEKELSVFNIHSNIDVTLLMLHSKYKNRVTIQKDYGEIPDIEGYSGQLNQVFMNILSNAIDSIPALGEIKIKTWKAEGEPKIKITITDTGSGIPKEIQHKIFDPFFTTKPTGVGVGLGLSISYGIIKDHNGDIEVKSVIGAGSEFTITLPLKQNA